MNLSKYIFKKPSLQISVDIGFGVLKIASLQIAPGETTLVSYKCEDLSQFKEETDRDAFILQQVDDFLKAHGVSNKNIHLNLPLTNAIYTKVIKLPIMPAREIPNAAKWQIKDELSFSIDESQFAWLYASPKSKPPKPKVDIVCVVAKKEFVNKYVELFKRSDISLSEITLSPFSINAILPVTDEWIAILDIGYKQSVFSMHSKGKLLFLRTIHVGADSVTQSQQEQLKANVEHLSDEIVRSIKYCEFEFSKQAINSIYLTGGGAKIETLQTGLKEVSGLDIKILRFPRNIRIDGNIRKDFEAKRDSLQLVPVSGAAITSIEKINILPLEARVAKLLLAEKISFRLVGLAVALILLLSFFTVKLNVNITGKRLNNAKAEIKLLSEAEALKLEINEYTEVIEKLKAGHILPGWGLKFIANTIPENMVLTSFVFNNKDNFINLVGVLYIKGPSEEGVINEFIHELKKIELFRDVQLLSVERATSTSLNFNIVCNILD